MILNKVLEMCDQNLGKVNHSKVSDGWLGLSFDERNKLLNYFKYSPMEREKTLSDADQKKFNNLQMWFLSVPEMQTHWIPLRMVQDICIKTKRKKTYGIDFSVDDWMELNVSDEGRLKPVKIDFKWEKLAEEERLKLLKYRELMFSDYKKLSINERIELDFLLQWTIENNISCADIPEGK